MRGLAVACLMLIACEGAVRKVPPTEVLVRVEATRDIRAVARQLRVSVAVQERKNGAWSDRTPVTVPSSGDGAPSWPVDIPIVPANPERPPHLFQVVAEALDESGQVLVQQRALTSFVSEAQLVLEILLTRCGSAPLGEICEESASCYGTECRNCVSDECADTEITEPDMLPILTSEPDSPDDDAGTSEIDANDGLGVPGDPCRHQDARACDGHDSKLPLLCNGAFWQSQSPCDDAQRCSTAPGEDRGMCQPVVVECVGRESAEPFCVADGMRECTDQLRFVDMKCPQHATCSGMPGDTTCICKDGYKDDGEGGCEDIDECEGSSLPCEHGGRCRNLMGSYSCTCVTNSGWTGPTCDQDVNECATDNGGCGDAAAWSCNNQVGAPPSCENLDECEGGIAAACGEGAVDCTDVEGSYSCECDAWFRPTSDEHGCLTRWSTPEEISSSENDNASNASVAMDGEGNAIAVWNDGSDVLSARYEPSSGWGAIERLGAGSDPAVAMDASGNAIAIWGRVARRFTKADGWFDEEEVWPASPTYAVVAISSSTGRSRIVGYSPVEDDGCGRVFTRDYEPGVGWGTTLEISDPSGCEVESIDVGLDEDGNALIAWTHVAPDYHVFVSHCMPLGACSPPLQISTKQEAQDVRIAVQSSGAAAVSWVQWEEVGDGEQYSVLVSRSLASGGASWSAPEPLYVGASPIDSHAIALADDETPFAVWHDGQEAIHAAQFDEENGWMSSVRLGPCLRSPAEDSACGRVFVVPYDAGRVAVVWNEEFDTATSDIHVWAIGYDRDTGWGPLQEVTEAHSSSHTATDRAGGLVAVFMQEIRMPFTPSTRSVWATHLSLR